ncbi:MAG: Gfo/Idh/MocA family protein [Actinomycetota bacterium]
MAARRLGVIMNGVTGRMGKNQHLLRSIMAIREEGGVALSDGSFVQPDPLLVGRNPEKVESLAREVGLEEWTTDLGSALANTDYPVYFDAQITSLRADAVRAALEAGKHVYCEKPLAEDLDTALDLARMAAKLEAKSGVVQDKLFLPGLVKLRELIDSGFFGRILSVKGDFGYWVFEGHDQEPQRPSWNYRHEDGGGIILDMFPHWHYVLTGLFGRIDSLTCVGATHIDERVDENGRGYAATADDAAYATFRLADGVIAQMNSSWCTRVDRDDLLTLQVDGTNGSAIAGLRECKIQSAKDTPRATWNPDLPNSLDFHSGWTEVPDSINYENGFKEQWTSFIAHVVEDSPFPWDLLQAARGIQLVDLALKSWRDGCWVRVEELEL